MTVYHDSYGILSSFLEQSIKCNLFPSGFAAPIDQMESEEFFLLSATWTTIVTNNHKLKKNSPISEKMN